MREFGHTKLKLISPVAFLATKHVAFIDRGNGDYYASHDLEDFVTVIDGREMIVTEVNAAPPELRRCVIDYVRGLRPPDPPRKKRGEEWNEKEPVAGAN